MHSLLRVWQVFIPVLMVLFVVKSQNNDICSKNTPQAPFCDKIPDSCGPTMKIFCLVYCGVCPEKVCEDQSPLCSFTKDKCDSDEEVRSRCPLTCGLCSSITTVTATTTIKQSSTSRTSAIIHGESTTPNQLHNHTLVTLTTNNGHSNKTSAMQPTTIPAGSVTTPTGLPTSNHEPPTTTTEKITRLITNTTIEKSSTKLPSETSTRVLPTTSTRLTTKYPATLGTSVLIKILNKTLIEVVVKMNGNVKEDDLEVIRQEVVRELNSTALVVYNSELVDIEDLLTPGGDPVTKMTIWIWLHSTSGSLGNSDKTSFKRNLHDRLAKTDSIDSYKGLYGGETKRKVPTPKPYGVKPVSSERPWAERYWYVIFVIGVIILGTVGAIVLICLTHSSWRQKKLNISSQEDLVKTDL